MTRDPFPVSPQRIPASVAHSLLPERDRQSQDPVIVRLPKDITRGNRYANETANAILSWLADNLTFDTNVTVPSYAVSAFKYSKEYSVDYSNRAVSLLRAAGLPERVAHEYLPPGYEL
jgi:transglutaminase-like putative cysteine protease